MYSFFIERMFIFLIFLIEVSKMYQKMYQKCIKNRRLKVIRSDQCVKEMKHDDQWVKKWNMLMHRCSFACRLTREGKWGKKIEDRILSSFFFSLQQRKKEKRRKRRRNRRGWKHIFYPWINTCIWARSIWCINFLQNCRQNERCVFLLFSHYLLFSSSSGHFSLIKGSSVEQRRKRISRWPQMMERVVVFKITSLGCRDLIEKFASIHLILHSNLWCVTAYT